MMTEQKPEYWKKACQDLSERCPILAKLVIAYPFEGLTSKGNAFQTLARAIVGQQISVKAAESVWNKTVKTLGTVTPESVKKTRTLSLRKSGLSERKVIYLKDLSAKFLDGTIDPTHWEQQTDQEIIDQLIAVKGVGVWTAEMFLIFHLFRPNIFPRLDLGLQKALSKSYGCRYPLSDRSLNKMEKHFKPWATVATWYLWRSLDPIPVEY